MDYKVISSDSHIDLEYIPEDLFVSNAPAAWRDKMPRIVETEAGLEWQADGLYLAPARGRSRNTLTPEDEDRMAKMAAAGFYEDALKGKPHPTTLELRLKDMDLDGIDAEVIYGLTFIGGRLLGARKSEGYGSAFDPDPERVSIILRIYNEWVADFCKGSPQRLAALACLPNHDPEAAAAELRRCAGIGLKGGSLEVQGSAKPIYYDDWDVLWAASAECHMPISFHFVGVSPRRPNSEDAGIEKYNRIFHSMNMALAPLEGPELLSTVILSGACERFPDFKFVLGECGVTWLPFVLKRLDAECTGFPGLTMKPSDYWRRQGYTTYQQEELVGELIGFVGEDNVMWGSDYPHPDGTWPESLDYIQRDLGYLPDQRILRKLTRDNGAKLYGFM